jgi:hypothetical protein
MEFAAYIRVDLPMHRFMQCCKQKTHECILFRSCFYINLGMETSMLSLDNMLQHEQQETPPSQRTVWPLLRAPRRHSTYRCRGLVPVLNDSTLGNLEGDSGSQLWLPRPRRGASSWRRLAGLSQAFRGTRALTLSLQCLQHTHLPSDNI